MPAAHQSSINDVLERLRAWEDGEHTTPVPAPPNINPVKQELKPPTYGGPQRDAIASIVDGVVDDFCRKVQSIRHALDRIEQQALQSAAHAKGSLNEHIVVSVRLNDEIERMGNVVTQIEETMAAGAK